MNENFNDTGYWFLPENKEEQISGEISYSPEDGVVIKFLGHFGDEKTLIENSYFPLILGVLQNGKKVTLIGSNKKNSTISFPGIPTMTLVSSYALVGQHFETLDDICFQQVQARFNNLYQFLNTNGIEEQRSAAFVNLKYTPPPNIDFSIENKLLSIQFLGSASYAGDNHKSFTILQDAHLQVKYDADTSINEILEDLSVFQGFLTFATFESSYPTKITFPIRNGNSFESYKVELFFRRIVERRAKGNKHFQYLFNYPQIQDCFQEVISNWWEHYDKLEPIIDLYLRSFYYYSANFSENQFLEIMHALESYHRRNYNNSLYAKPVFKEIKSEILAAVPEKHRPLLTEKLNFANEPALQRRLEELFSCVDSYDFIKRIVPDTKIFIREIKQTRNYFTHYSKELESKSLKGVELYYATMKLRVILTILLLKKINIPEDSIKNAVSVLKDFHFNHI